MSGADFTTPDGETDWKAFADHVLGKHRALGHENPDGGGGHPGQVQEVYHALDEVTNETSMTTSAKAIAPHVSDDSKVVGSTLRVLEQMGAVEKLNDSRPYTWRVRR